MKNLNWKKNEEYNQLEATFAAKLKSVGEQELENSNGTPYYVVTGEFDGQTFSAMMYAKNYEHGVEIGETYSCRAVFNPERSEDDVLITMSHLTSGNRLKTSDLGLTQEMIKSLNNDENVEEEVVDKAEEYSQKA